MRASRLRGPPNFFAFSSQKNRLPRGPLTRRLRGLDPRPTGCPEDPFSTEERFNLRRSSMTISYRLLQTAGYTRIERGGQIYSEDQLHEDIWLLNMETRQALYKEQKQDREALR